MPKERYYSPIIRRDLISQLYHRAKAEQIPMTKLANRIIEEAMGSPEISCRVAESPPTSPALPSVE